MLKHADLLFPTPKRWTPSEGVWHPSQSLVVRALDGSEEAMAPLAHLQATLESAGFVTQLGPDGDTRTGSTVALRIAAAHDLPPQGYRLAISNQGVEIVASSECGLHHGVATLGQWLDLAKGEEGGPLPQGVIGDWPDIGRRGVLIDVSRGKVPTLSTLKGLASRLAGWKINEIQLYLEHAFAYQGHEIVWRNASPLTPGDVRELDSHCHQLGIELVPNQNSFGHLHRWLVHEPYRRLAECPEGVEHPFSRGQEPFSLCPLDPGSISLLADLYDQLLPCFRSRQANAGLDETFDLGRCRSREACAKRGRETVYLEFLSKVHELLSVRAHRMQFWGDILLEHPERLPEVPADAIPLAWGYEADYPFAAQASRLAATGLDFYLCPGTSSWLSFAGRLDNALHNLANGARAAADSGALGLLITDWGDQGHLQPLPVSYLPLLAGAAFAWNRQNADEVSSRNWSALFDRLVLPNGDLGEVACGLARVHRLLGTPDRNATALFHLLASPWDPIDHPRYRRLTVEGLDRVETALENLGRGTFTTFGSRDEEDRESREFDWVASALSLAVRVGRARLATQDRLHDIPRDERRSLARSIQVLVEERRALWLYRNRPGGLDGAMAPLDELAGTLL